jgi:monoamine oxidase
MAHTPLFDRVVRALQLARASEKLGISTGEALERHEAALSRRSLLRGAVGVAAAATFAGCAPDDDEETSAVTSGVRSGARIAVVGAGIAGLTAAYKLAARGFSPVVYDAGNRVGGRVATLRGGGFASKVEIGGELIDTGHRRTRKLARDLGLTLVDQAAAVASLETERYALGGRVVSLAEVVDQFRAVIPVLEADLAALGPSEYVTFDESTAAGRRIERQSIADWFVRAGVSGSLRTLLDVAYTSEYGLEVDQQSYLNLLVFISTNPEPFQIFGDSDERFTVAEGNGAMVTGLVEGLPSPVRLGHALVALRGRADGTVRLSFDRGGRPLDVVADRVVLALPFNQLRRCALDVELPAAKRRSIARLRYGTNAKVMVGTSSRPWAARGAAGTSFHDRVYHESWDSSRGFATTGGVLTSFTGGRFGVAVGEGSSAQQGRRFVDEVERVFPGVAAAYTGRVLRAHWPTEPWFDGSYACYQPGDYSDFVGSEAAPAGALHFAGEHTSLDAQGFIEGAVESGERAAREVRQALLGR